jgi:hypothetical protein
MGRPVQRRFHAQIATRAQGDRQDRGRQAGAMALVVDVLRLPQVSA